jgi:hypothetical protein
MSHKGRYDNLVVLAKGALNFLSSLRESGIFIMKLSRMMLLISLSAMVWCGGTAVAQTESVASEPKEVSTLLDQIEALLRQKKYGPAIVKLEALYRLQPKSVILYNIAVAHDKLRASCQTRNTAYERFFAECKGCKEKQAALKRFKTIQSACFGTLKVDTHPEKVMVGVDDRSLGQAPQKVTLVEGPHVVWAQNGKRRVFQKVKITANKTQTVQLTVQPVVSDLPKAMVKTPPAAVQKSGGHIVEWSLLGGGAVVAGLGAYLMSGASQIDTDAKEDPHSVSFGDYTDAEDQHAMGTALLGVGTTAVVGGLTWWFLNSRPKSKQAQSKARPSLTVGASPGMIYLGGTL